MRILHTSDWHIGRTFHEYPTLDAAKFVLGQLPELIRKHEIDVVVAAGDIYDSGKPKPEAVEVLRDLFKGVLDAGAKLVVTSGNHDNAMGLDFAGTFSAGSGLHIMADVSRLMKPVELSDEHGSVDFYGIPFIDPVIHRHLEWIPEKAVTQHEVISAAMDQIRFTMLERQSKGRRSVVLSHTFVAGAEKESSDTELPITREPLVAGGLDNVPVNVFDGMDYVALGHIHGRAELKNNVRYSGAIMHFSFKEAKKPRGGWLLDLLPGKDARVEWIDFPIFRQLSEIKGSFNDILTKEEYKSLVDHYVRVVYTDDTPVIDANRKLAARFPHFAEVVHLPANRAARNEMTYTDRIKGKPDIEVIESFLKEVRNGEKASKEELAILSEALAEVQAEELGL
jgi:exonuclease SbcD